MSNINKYENKSAIITLTSDEICLIHGGGWYRFYSEVLDKLFALIKQMQQDSQKFKCGC